MTAATMVRTALHSIAPNFIVRNVPLTLSFYCDRLGFEVTYSAPETDPFFAIVQRDGVMIFVKAVSNEIAPLPNKQRHPWAPWDAYVYVPEPDALADEFIARGATLTKPLADNSDGLRGFEVQDPDGYTLFFGRPR